MWESKQYANKFGKLSSGHRTGKSQFSFQSQRKAMLKSVQNYMIGISNFLKRFLVCPILLFPLFLCIVHLERLSYLSLLISGTLHSVGIFFPFSFAFHFSSFLCYLYGLLWQTFCLLVFLFLWDGFGHHLLYNVMNLHPSFFRHSVYQI